MEVKIIPTLTEEEVKAIQKTYEILSEFESECYGEKTDLLQKLFEDTQEVRHKNALPTTIDFLDMLLIESGNKERY